MPYVKFICVKCGYTQRCEAKLFQSEFSETPFPPLCFYGLTEGIDEFGEQKDRADFEYIECRLDEV